MNKKLHILLIAILITVSSLFLSSCQKEDIVQSDDKGNIACYTLTDIYKNKMFGFYVKNKDKTFSPVMPDMPGFVFSSDGYYGNKGGRYFWWANELNKKGKELDHEKLTPVVTENTPLVAIFENSSMMPEKYIIERYEDMGFTVGAKFFISDSGEELLLGTREHYMGSSAEQIIKEAGNDEFVRVVSINKSKNLPIGNVDTTINNLLGCQENKYYEFGVYIGTTYRSYVVKADTRVFKAREAISLDNPLKETDKQYFTINLPANMRDGYYTLNDSGVFKYKSSEKKAIKIVSDTDENKTKEKAKSKSENR